MDLEKLQVYTISRDISKAVWDIYQEMGKENKILIGQQLVRSVDSVGANIAEGYGRFHYLDSAKFYYNARGSLSEARHWVELLSERQIIKEGPGKKIINDMDMLGKKLNSFITTLKNKATKTQ